MRQWRTAVLTAGLGALLAGCGGSTSSEVERTVRMTGAVEVPPGDPDGSGQVVIELDVEEGQVCWSLSTKGIEPPSVAHIHRGPRGEAGPPVVTWALEGPTGEGCVEADRSLIRDIARDPGRYYVNVHNEEHPDGALRGQLGPGD
jgi:hypothetical protein